MPLKDANSIVTGATPPIHSWTVEPPKQDRIGEPYYWRFGSVHPGGCCIATCDGAVRMVHYIVDTTVHGYLGNRSDGVAIEKMPWGD